MNQQLVKNQRKQVTFPQQETKVELCRLESSCELSLGPEFPSVPSSCEYRRTSLRMATTVGGNRGKCATFPRNKATVNIHVGFMNAVL